MATNDDNGVKSCRHFFQFSIFISEHFRAIETIQISDVSARAVWQMAMLRMKMRRTEKSEKLAGGSRSGKCKIKINSRMNQMN